MKKTKILSALCVALAVLATGTVSAWAYGVFTPTAPVEAETVQSTQQANIVQLSSIDVVPLSFTDTVSENLWTDENDWTADFFAEYGELTLSEAIEKFIAMYNAQAEERLSAAIADGTITEEQALEIMSRKPEAFTADLPENELWGKYKDVPLNELKERLPEIMQEIDAIQLDGEMGTVGEQIANLSGMTLGEALDMLTTGMDEKLSAALADGTITQEQADKINDRFGNMDVGDNEIFQEYKDMNLGELIQTLPQIMKNGVGAIGNNLNGINIADMLEQYGDMTLGEAMEKMGTDMTDTTKDISSLRERLDAAVTEGKITQEHADEVLANLSQKNLLGNDILSQYKDVKVSELGSILPEIMKGFTR